MTDDESLEELEASFAGEESAIHDRPAQERIPHDLMGRVNDAFEQMTEYSDEFSTAVLVAQGFDPAPFSPDGSRLLVGEA